MLPNALRATRDDKTRRESDELVDIFDNNRCYCASDFMNHKIVFSLRFLALLDFHNKRHPEIEILKKINHTRERLRLFIRGCLICS